MKPEDREVFERIAEGLEKSVRSSSGFFGLSFRDVIVGMGILLAIWAFYIRTNDAMDNLIKANKYFSDFAQNSDAYHSATTGTQFYQGRPLNPGYQNTGIQVDPDKIKNIKWD